MELSSEIDVQVAKGLGGVKPNMQLIYVFIYHVRSTTGDGIPTGLCDIGLHRCIKTRLVSKLKIGITSEQSLSTMHLPPSVGSVHLFVVQRLHSNQGKPLNLEVLSGRPVPIYFKLR